ncbi:hypothetical protein BGX38DRAFT_1171777 [Terfezia claveryi]|nr:hypothetical protein BGX38DRAFT_1171777 [Terfezia claveryi]
MPYAIFSGVSPLFFFLFFFYSGSHGRTMHSEFFLPVLSPGFENLLISSKADSCRHSSNKRKLCVDCSPVASALACPFHLSLACR